MAKITNGGNYLVEAEDNYFTLPNVGEKPYNYDTQLWDNLLYRPMMATIRGSIYGVISRDELDEQLFNIAKRAVNTFKFPRVKTNYTVFYAVRKEYDPETLELAATSDTEGAIPHGVFENVLTDKEVEVILAWMKVYWIEALLSNTDDFETTYTDSNIKTFSRANLVQQNTQRYREFLAQAHEIETRYSRVNADCDATIGDINEEN